MASSAGCHPYVEWHPPRAAGGGCRGLPWGLGAFSAQRWRSSRAGKVRREVTIVASSSPRPWQEHTPARRVGASPHMRPSLPPPRLSEGPRYPSFVVRVGTVGTVAASGCSLLTGSAPPRLALPPAPAGRMPVSLGHATEAGGGWLRQGSLYSAGEEGDRELSPSLASQASTALVAKEQQPAGAGAGAAQTSEQPPEVVGVLGKTIVITGASSGIGFAAARELAMRGADVILACRSEEKGARAVGAIEGSLWRLRERQPHSHVEGTARLMLLDLASLGSVKAFASRIRDEHDHVDILMCNAGILMPPHTYTEDGFELQFQVNYLSHYALTRLLTPTLLRSPSRPSVILTSSFAGECTWVLPGGFWRVARRTPQAYHPFVAYCQSKLSQVLFSVEASRRYGDTMAVHSVHPGIVNTDLFKRNLPPRELQLTNTVWGALQRVGLVYSPIEGASTGLFLAMNPSSKHRSGGYWGDCRERRPNPLVWNDELRKEWWEESAVATGLESLV